MTPYTAHTVIRVTVLLTWDDFPLLTTRGLEDPADNNMPQSPDKAGCSLRAVPQPLHTNQPASNLLPVLPQTLLISQVRACPQCTPGRAEAVREGGAGPTPWVRLRDRGFGYRLALGFIGKPKTSATE